jgi:hypothetical protein
MYAHLFKNSARRGGGFLLTLSPTCDISQGISQELVFATKREAKAYAASIQAMPWNY